jgi:DNA-binding transcriptional MerR regulator
MAIAFLTGRKPGTIRSWASRGLITRRGTDGDGRALYGIDDAQALAGRLDSQRERMQHQKRTAGMPETRPRPP